MKTRNKALLMALCAVLLVTATVLGTMAYLTSTTDTVTNTFTAGKVAITLDETDVDDSTPNADRDTANAYTLVAGENYVKDPTVHVQKGSQESWLFVKVDASSFVTNAEVATGSNKTIAEQMSANGWTLVSGQTNVYAYKETVEAEDDVEVFGKIYVKDGYAGTDVSAITVQAYAVQASGFATAAAAYDAAPCTWTA